MYVEMIYKMVKWQIVAAVVVIGIIFGIVLLFNRGPRIYHYIDLDGNQGVGKECFEDSGALFCYQYYNNGMIQVKEFHRVEKAD